MATRGDERMSRHTAHLQVLFSIGVIVFASCSTSDSGGGDLGGVPWGDYAPSLQAQIDAMATAKDCDGLQIEFNQADANNVATANRVGHNNVELMKYIDDKQRAANCF
jgi:hypothetical protein